ncbi:hypothetical protein DFA_06019 [Cavenderia fasciculata]|uniref:PD-(D/E)XK endonuclease-like domain-containing protein n=1 Tax=Cavenderia fasciculata TaxID=261658 RepID=F4PJV7_CACFS|nr:uncharacterized protein DFA_06019 [Cavenderia fasciculata]EGG23881.1 hypothetical protein DFA_06019 [Cavenderia fasciculata]|eukprot:XP_004361732.1 hypothetical protein DFA_06019 [Cavenderia fasciculata]
MTSNVLSSAAAKISRVMKYGQRFYSIPSNYKLGGSAAASGGGGGEDQPPLLLPSVTTILRMINKPFLINWEKSVMIQAIKEHYTTSKPAAFQSSAEEHQWLDSIITSSKSRAEEIKNEASTFGTRAHEWIDKKIDLKGEDGELLPREGQEGEEEETPEDLKNLAIAFQDWKKESGLTLERRDTIVWSEKYGYAGAVDAVGRTKDGQLVAIDWKTSSMISNEYALQVAAYAKALEELTGEVIKEAWIVRFHKKLPLYETKQVKDIDRSFQTFLGTLELWKTYNENDLYLDLKSNTKLSNSNDFFFQTNNNTSTNNNINNINVYTPTQKNYNNKKDQSTASSPTQQQSSSVNTTTATEQLQQDLINQQQQSTFSLPKQPPRYIVKNKGLAI